MYKKAIEKDLKQIFETRRVDFMGVETCLEQDVLCVDVSRVRSGAQEGKAWARVFGSVGIRGTIKKNPVGFLTKKIAQAEPEVLKRFWFAPVEMPASTPAEWELKAYKVEFVYFYQEEYAPVKGVLEYAKMFWDMVVNAIPKNPIEPIPEPEPEPEPEPTTKIDENTIGLWNFETDRNDVMGNYVEWGYSNSAKVSAKFPKFGTGRLQSGGVLKCAISDTQPFTMDLQYRRSSSTGSFGLMGNSGGWGIAWNRGGVNVYAEISSTLLTLYAKGLGEDKSASIELPAAWENLTYAHLAITYDGEKEASLWYNGKPVCKVEGLTPAGKDFKGIAFDCKNSTADSANAIDEVRLSNVVRYTKDFTPPEEPYSA